MAGAAVIAWGAAPSAQAFVPAALGSVHPMRGAMKGQGEPVSDTAGPVGTAAAVAAAVCGIAVASASLRRRAKGRVQMHYSTATILPSLVYQKTGFKTKDIKPGQMTTCVLAGIDVNIGKTQSGKLFCMANKCGPIGGPLDRLGVIEGENVREEQYGCKWNCSTGEVVEWCTVPILGAVLGFVFEPQDQIIFDFRTAFLSDDIEVLVDVNARKAYEAPYWKGVLDAQGKNDGTYY